MNVNVIGGSIPKEEINYYIETMKEKNPDKYFTSFNFTLNGEFVDVNYTYDNVPFERIRRITGYLVGTVDRFNNAKRAEVNNRLTHNTNKEEVYQLEEIA